MIRDAERSLTDPWGLPGRPWYSPPNPGSGLLTGYRAKTLPGIREAIVGRRWSEAQDYIGRMAPVLRATSERLDRARALVADGA